MKTLSRKTRYIVTNALQSLKLALMLGIPIAFITAPSIFGIMMVTSTVLITIAVWAVISAVFSAGISWFAIYKATKDGKVNG